MISYIGDDFLHWHWRWHWLSLWSQLWLFPFFVGIVQDLFLTPITLLLLRTDFDERKLKLRPVAFAFNPPMYFCFQLLKVAAGKIRVLLSKKHESAQCIWNSTPKGWRLHCVCFAILIKCLRLVVDQRLMSLHGFDLLFVENCNSLCKVTVKQLMCHRKVSLLDSKS